MKSGNQKHERQKHTTMKRYKVCCQYTHTLYSRMRIIRCATAATVAEVTAPASSNTRASLFTIAPPNRMHAKQRQTDLWVYVCFLYVCSENTAPISLNVIYLYKSLYIFIPCVWNGRRKHGHQIQCWLCVFGTRFCRMNVRHTPHWKTVHLIAYRSGAYRLNGLQLAAFYENWVWQAHKEQRKQHKSSARASRCMCAIRMITT